MHHIFTILKSRHIVGIPLEHFPAAIQILSVVICPAEGVLIDVRQLGFNPGGVIALFMEDGTHSVAEAVPGYATCIAYTTDQYVHRHFAYGFAVMDTAGEDIKILTGNRL